MCPRQQPVVDHHVQLLDKAHPHQVLALAEPVNNVFENYSNYYKHAVKPHLAIKAT